MLKPKKRWSLAEADSEKANELCDKLKLSSLVSALLVNRGIHSAEAAEQFLHTEKQPFLDPFLMKGMEEAVSRIKKAVSNSEQIVIYGDYDADGVSSTTIMLETLRKLGAIAEFYIPNRFTEGYGPNEGAFRKLKEKGCSLIITVDTGIAAVNEASLARELGMDLIITDHHEPGPVLPEALAIIHPKQEGCFYPFKELAGAGVALKLASALLGEIPEELLEVAAIGTIADLVPLHGENRLIASRGIGELRRTVRPGLKALLKLSGTSLDSVNEETIGFAIGPRINAVGRLGAADPAVDLLMTKDPEAAAALAEQVDTMNKERQKLVSSMTEEAIQHVEQNYPVDENPVLVIAQENWNAGVVGIVASRLVDKFYRPAIVLSIDPETGNAKGSARSIEGFDLFANLSQCRDILPHFGGHPMAAGMTLKQEDVGELRSRLSVAAKSKLTPEDLVPISKVDISCSLEEVTISTIEELNLLAPFGMGNPKPVVHLSDVLVENAKRIGSDSSHIKLVLKEEQALLDCIGFGFGSLYEEMAPLSKVSVIGELSVNEWNNRRKPQLMLHDLAIDQWQLFDWRGARDPEKLAGSISPEKRALITFQKENYNRLLQLGYHPLLADTKEAAIHADISGKYAVLFDTPDELDLVKYLFHSGLPQRVYAIFNQHEDAFFSTQPNREHFKWFYSFLVKKSPFNLKQNGELLAKHKGWSKDTVDFMSRVFFELDFVTIENGVISIADEVKKRDLMKSKTYSQRQHKVELEKMLLYTSYLELKQWFEENMKQSSMLLNV
ncbi:single-stranded-DNA-specific exonuclease RecJ [Bacillus lacus]|uniref:Single-stranded-DNA-specific exonuclease RecJ n=1 Tax=Metabacillus lacus TaxID=1983721 RepID=A0A7X2IX09_9BACI|nr:single-stranded-DNA-specific exonuclease RecJ [Metabacillus lacus]MRX71387.1 single-stranded-DNA-specific exonuclease RecJ [Metabacillus lacus]